MKWEYKNQYTESADFMFNHNISRLIKEGFEVYQVIAIPELVKRYSEDYKLENKYMVYMKKQIL